MTNRNKIDKIAKQVDAGNANVTDWHAVILDERDGKYYENSLKSTRRRLTDEELAAMKAPGHGMIVLKLVDAPVPEENIRSEE